MRMEKTRLTAGCNDFGYYLCTLGTVWLSGMDVAVIKVDNTNDGDYTRQCCPFINGCSNYYAAVNHN